MLICIFPLVLKEHANFEQARYNMLYFKATTEAGNNISVVIKVRHTNSFDT